MTIHIAIYILQNTFIRIFINNFRIQELTLVMESLVVGNVNALYKMIDQFVFVVQSAVNGRSRFVPMMLWRTFCLTGRRLYRVSNRSCTSVSFRGELSDQVADIHNRDDPTPSSSDNRASKHYQVPWLVMRVISYLAATTTNPTM